jgi:hypothetical protein
VGGSSRRKVKPRRAALDAESLPSDFPARPASAPPPLALQAHQSHADRRPPPARRSDGDAPASATRVSARVLAASAGGGTALPPRPSRSAGARSSGLFSSEHGLASGAATASAEGGSGKLRTRPTNNQLL